MIEAKQQLEEAFAAMYTAQPTRTESEQPTVPVATEPEREDKRENVEFGTDLLKRICARAQAGVPMETIEKYYKLSDEARKCVEIAIKIK